MSAELATFQVLPPSTETSTAATLPSVVNGLPSLSVAVPVIVTGVSASTVSGRSLIEATAAVVSVDALARFSPCEIRKASATPGWIPMSANMLITNCWMSTFSMSAP